MIKYFYMISSLALLLLGAYIALFILILVVVPEKKS